MSSRIFAFLASVMLPIACSGQKVDNSPVSSFIPDNYLGNWFEIARFDHSFERDVQFATARYTMTDKGTIKVINSGIRNGRTKTSVGKAKFTDTPGMLRVSFFGPFYSDYRVMMLASDYSYALVGSDSDNYLWILSRTPKLEKATQDMLVSEAKRRGYDTNKLIWVEHE